MNLNFYYYGTYTAALAAGMTSATAQRLAYFCASVEQFQAGSEATSPWFYKGETFRPCVTRSARLGAAGASVKTLTEMGSRGCDLTFRYLPDLSPFEPIAAHGVDLPTGIAGGRQYKYLGADSRAFAATSTNPLTGIDWLRNKTTVAFKGNEAEASRLTGNNERTIGYTYDCRRHEERRRTPLVTARAQSGRTIAQLQCSKNNSTAKAMMFETVRLIHERGTGDDFALALLGCRLNVYQSTWLPSLERNKFYWRQHNRWDCSALSRVNEDDFIDAFLWTYRVIYCAMWGKDFSAEEDLAYSIKPADGVISAVGEAVRIKGNPLRAELCWLKGIPVIASSQSRYTGIYAHSWQNGIRFRDHFLLDEARLTASSDDVQEISSITGFRKSDYFWLHKAAEFHSSWFAKKLEDCGFKDLDVTQSVGTTGIWDIKN